MLAFAIAYLFGDLWLQQFTVLPSAWMVYSAALVFVGLSFSVHKHVHCGHVISGFMLGFAWTYWCATSLLVWELSHVQEGQSQILAGYVASIPAQDGMQTNFFLQPEHTHILVKLYWRTPIKSVQVGDKWQFVVKLKRIHGSQNPGGFDYEAWALQKGLRASGTVIPGQHNKLLSHSWLVHPIDQLRQALLRRISANLPSSATAVWLPALIIGERSHVPQQQWQVLRKTGTNHLMAIAGLHIGIMAGIAHFLMAWLWRRSRYLCLRIPAQHAGACAALVLALSYSAMSGFSIPTQRACIMLSIFIITMLLRRSIYSWSVWSLALVIVLSLNPLSVLAESIWLSFGTIALIIYGMSSRLAPQGWWWKWGRVQAVIGVGLVPFSLLLFQQASIISFLANSIAIPWLGFFILPFCFLSGVFFIFFQPLGVFFLNIANQSLVYLWLVLDWLSQLSFATWQHAIPNSYIFMLTLLAFVVLLLPRGAPGRWLGLFWLSPLLLQHPVALSKGEIKLTVLEVGQGLSAVVQTKNHILVYDAGPRRADSMDAGESIVLPYLQSIQVKKIDKLMISHGDNDHIGGAGAILASLPVIDLLSSVPDAWPPGQARLCQAGQQWMWDDVTFTILYPTARDLQLGNDSSCVLRIENADHSVLLTGDIERYAETQLVQRSLHELSANILVAPHHGSKTSSLPRFLMAVHPDFVLYPIGYRNRYHFPHTNVMDMYQQLGAQQYDTASSGAISFDMIPGEPLNPPQLYRYQHWRYWLHSNH